VVSTRDQTPPRKVTDVTTPRTHPFPILNIIKIDFLNFDGRHDSLLFIDWILQVDRYFTWYEITESRKAKYAAMKLSGQTVSIGLT